MEERDRYIREVTAGPSRQRSPEPTKDIHEVKVFGCVELISSDGRVQGWTRVLDPNVALRVEARLDERLVGSTVTALERKDVGGTFGYQLLCDRPLEMADLLSGRLRIRAIPPGARACDLPLTPRARALCLVELIRSEAARLGPEDLSLISSSMTATTEGASAPAAAQAVDMQRSSEKDAILQRLKRLRSSDAPPSASNIFSSVLVPLGHVSHDGTVILGHEGHLYLVGGSNNVLEQYLADPDIPGLKLLADKWLAKIEGRLLGFQQIGARFLQVIVPEKLAVVPDYFPYKIPRSSPILSLVEQRLFESSVPYLSGLSILRQSASRQTSFAKTDSHLSVRATFELYTAILERMALAPPFAPTFMGPTVVEGGDLSTRVLGVPMYELQHFVASEFQTDVDRGVRLVDQFVPDAGHIGARCVWRNECAPIPVRVVAFANSFFERGASARGLSWWFARTFAEFHFIWSPNAELDYVVRHKPDWVICQTIERFLSHAPVS